MRKQTQSRQYGYVSPKCRTIRLEQKAGFCASGDSGLYSGSNKAGNIMNDDSNYTYDL